MFTGIVQTMGRVAAVDPTPAGVRLIIDPQGWAPPGQPIRHGDSICVAGCCLTVAALDDALLHFDVISETLGLTTLGRLRVGSAVNLEPSLTPTTPMGGHFVQGHIDGVGTVKNVQQQGDDYRIAIEPPAELADYVVPKGSIAIEGVSLTVASVSGGRFDVALIPTTLKLTTLGQLQAGDQVNLESDILTRTIVQVLRRQQGR